MSEKSPQNILEKYPFLAKNGKWIILLLLLLAGMYLTFSYFWRLTHSEEKAKK